MTKTDASKKANPVRRFLALLGPGLITGAADDDPSGITTYSIVGAQMGTGMLWTAFITWPFMGAVQLHVRAHWHGHWCGTWRCAANKTSALVGLRRCARTA